MSEDITPATLLVTEYESLKREQAARIGTRDNLVYAVLAAMGLVGLRVGADARLLLLLPPAVVALGWTRVANDIKVTHIGCYVRDELAVRLGAVTGEAVFGWEHAYRTNTRRLLRKICQMVADLLLFTVAPLTALVIFWWNGSGTVGLLIVSVGEALLVAGLGAVIVTYSGVFRWLAKG